MKLSVGILMAGILSVSVNAASLDLEKASYKSGEEIKVSFIASSSYPKNAWVGIIPSSVPHGQESVNDQNDLAYQYLGGKKMGELVFKAPLKEGSYDLRMNDTDANGKEVASVSFKVVAAPRSAEPAKSSGNSVAIERYRFTKGEQIKVSFTALDSLPGNAWIGIIPSDVPHGSEAVNDQYDVSYQYLGKKTSGVLMFKAPLKSGNYDIRMHDTDGNGVEIGNVSFTVE